MEEIKMEEIEVNSLSEYVDQLIKKGYASSEAVYQVQLVGYKFNDDGDIKEDGYLKILGECDDLFEAKQLATSIKSVRQTLDSDSEIIMVRVQAILKTNVEYEAQVEFTKKK
jgi:hypothetical protein